jgi:S1-C subfamily serine protease
MSERKTDGPRGRRDDCRAGPRFAQLLALAVPLALGACCQDCMQLNQLGAVAAVGSAPTSAAVAQPSAAPAGADDALAPSSDSGGEAVGGGIYINPQGDVLTTWDQVADCRKLAVLDDSTLLPATILAGNPVRSLALLRTERSTRVFAKFRSTPPAVGSTVRAITYPILDGVPLPIAAAAGSLRSASSPTGVDGIIQSATLVAGQSPGGAVVDQQGEVIGITVTRLEEDWPTGFTYGIATPPIARFAAAAGLQLAQGPAAGSGTDALVRAHDFVVPLICFR